MQAKSIVVQRITKAWLQEINANIPSRERRLQRFLAQERVEVEKG
jgi:hypothetical protein